MPLPLILGAIGAGAGLIGSIGQAFARSKANKELGKLLNKDPQYKENQIAKDRLALAQTLLNARMPGSMAARNNIYQTTANQVSGINKGATDASQAIAAAAGAYGQADQEFTNLGVAEAQDYQRRYGNLVSAQEGMIDEGDKVYNDSVRRYGDEVAIKGAQQENRMNTWKDITNFGGGLMNFGLASGFGNFGSGSYSGVGKQLYNQPVQSTRPNMPNPSGTYRPMQLPVFRY